MSKWQKVDDAKAAGDKLPNMLPGTYQVRISNVKDFEGYQGDLFYIIEFEILESSNENIEVGKFYSQVIKYNQPMGPINVKRFLMAATGFDPNDPDNEEAVTSEEVEQSLEEDDPLGLKGLEMGLQCDDIRTREGKPFTKHTWEAIEPD